MKTIKIKGDVMSKNENKVLGFAKKGIAKLDTDVMRVKVTELGDNISEKASDIKQLTIDAKEDIIRKINELDDMLSEEITNYNDAYTLMNDKGTQLYIERSKAADSLSYVETLVNSIANHPKKFDDDFNEINIEKRKFQNVIDFANRELLAAREAAGGVGAGLVAGASVACMGPTAAIWVATTFGTASTGTAISTLSGAAASNAALAWLGGGTLAAGGGGTAAGEALLAMAGPIGWSIAGATLAASIVLFAKNKKKLNKEKNEEIEAVKRNTESVKEIEKALTKLVDETSQMSSALYTSYTECFEMSGKDYSAFSEEQKMRLGALVNNAKSLSAMFGKTVE